MRDYGKVHISFWTSETIRAMSEDARALSLYLLTCPHNTIAGVFRLPDGYVCDDMQWTIERVLKAFKETLDKGFANRCETTKWVCINHHLKWNPPENPNQRTSASKIAKSIPDQCSWKTVFMSDYGGFLGIQSEPLANPFETLSKPVTVTVTETVINKPHPTAVGSPIKKTIFNKPEDVSELVWNDFLIVRKAKKSPITESSISGIRREAGKANISFEDALIICIERNWQSFKSDWLDPTKDQKSGSEIFKGVI